jgi:hypothetical protein
MNPIIKSRRAWFISDGDRITEHVLFLTPALAIAEANMRGDRWNAYGCKLRCTSEGAPSYAYVITEIEHGYEYIFAAYDNPTTAQVVARESGLEYNEWQVIA